MPDTSDVERTPEQAAADSAAGMQWWNSAIISGGDMQLYGVPLGGGRFIWVDDDGARWLVDARALHGKAFTAASAPASVEITLTRFGVFPWRDEVLDTVEINYEGRSASQVVFSSAGLSAGWRVVSSSEESLSGDLWADDP